MARSVTFNGQTRFKPGGISRVNAGALTPIGLSATGIVGLLGEADGGAPGTSGIITVDDPALAKDLFRSGPLADALGIAFNPSGDNRIPGGAFRALVYKTNASTQSTLHLPGDEALLADTAAGAPTTTSVDLTTNTTMVVNDHVGRWFRHVPTGEIRRIVSNDADTIVVSPGFTAAPTAADAVQILETQLILTSQDYGLHTTQISAAVEAGTGETFQATTVFEDNEEISPEIGGTSSLNVKYVGGAQMDTGEIASVDATGLIITGTLAASNGFTPPVASAWDGKVIRFANGLQRLILSHTATPTDPVVITLAAGHGLTTAQAAAVVGTSAEIINVDSADVSFTGSSGVATGVTSAVLPTADNLALTFDPNESIRAFRDRVNATTNYEISVPNGVNVDTTLMKTFDFGTRATAVDVRFDTGIDPDNKATFRRDLQVLVDQFNNFSEIVTATRGSDGAGDGSELPNFAYTAIAQFLSGGVRGISTNASFQAGFDAMIEERMNQIVPLISQDLVNEGNGSTAEIETVAAQLRAHVIEARGTGHNEQGSFLGFKGNKDAILAQANALNDTDAQIIPQRMQFLDVNGNLTLFDEWAAAVAAAGMRSGAPEIGEPLTFKFIQTSRVEQDNSWSPTALTDVNQFIQNGVMFAEAASGGFRWVRDITTHIQDDNIAYIDAHMRDAVRFVAFDLRQSIEDRFTGLKATPANAASIRAFVVAKMDEYLKSNIIVESLDPETETELIPGYRKLRVFIEGNTATVRVEIFPVAGIVFQLSDINLQLPRIAA